MAFQAAKYDTCTAQHTTARHCCQAMLTISKMLCQAPALMVHNSQQDCKPAQLLRQPVWLQRQGRYRGIAGQQLAYLSKGRSSSHRPLTQQHTVVYAMPHSFALVLSSWLTLGP